MSHHPSPFLSVFAFFLAGFIRPELYLMLKICVKLYIKIFHVQHTYLQVCANGIIVGCVFFVLLFFFFPPPMYRMYLEAILCYSSRSISHFNS